MGIMLSYLFDNPANYVFDTDKIEFIGTKARLKLRNNSGQLFQQGFSSDVGFTYDNLKTEFSADVMRQKDTRPAGAALYVPYSSVVNGTWGNGVLTGTPSGSPAIVGGKLDLTGYVNKYVTYPAAGNVTNALQQGCIRFRITPNYSGTPTSRQNFFAIGGANVNSNLTVYHDSSTGYLYVSIYNQTGIAIYSSYIQAGLYWVPVAGTEYEFELNYNLDSPNGIRLFINGTLWGIAVGSSGVRSAANLSTIWVGAIRGAIPAPSNNFSIRNLMFFDTVQHTANYTPNWSSIYDTIYVTDTITLPEMIYSGAGTLISADDFATSEAGAPRYTIQIGRSGNYLYWDGAAWQISNGSYAQANDALTFAANVAALPVMGELYGQFKIHFPDGNTQCQIDILNISLTAQAYVTDNPTIYPNASFRHADIEQFSASIIETGGSIRFILTKNETKYFWDGIQWAISDSSFSQSNTIDEIVTNKSSFTDSVTETKWIALFHSDGVGQVEIENVDVTYNFSGETPDAIEKAIVWGYVYDFEGNPRAGVRVVCQLEPAVVKYKNTILRSRPVVIETDSDGYFEFEVAENGNISGDSFYSFTIDKKKFTARFPAAGTYSLSEIAQ